MESLKMAIYSCLHKLLIGNSLLNKGCLTVTMLQMLCGSRLWTFGLTDVFYLDVLFNFMNTELAKLQVFSFYCKQKMQGHAGTNEFT